MRPALPYPNPVLRRLGWTLVVLVSLAARASEAPSEGPSRPEDLPADSKVLHKWDGGVDPRPNITSVQRSETDLLLKWTGLGGPYHVERRTSVTDGSWTAVGDNTMDDSLSVPPDGDIGFLRIQGPRPDYVGQSVCRGCHMGVHDSWAETVHSGALETLKQIGQGANAECLPCHTVGFGLPGGFVSEDTTPRLAGVQCENCHGPAGPHVSDPGNLAVRPVVSQAALTCGGCHTDFHHPTYDEWLGAGHAHVTEDVASGFVNPDTAAADARMRSCGTCHSGAVRLALLNGAKNGDEHPPMPSGDQAANTAITCAVCHTAHTKTEFGSQLRNPTYSTNFFSYSTSTNTNFTLQYDPQINVCGQCHNQRGARWQDTSRPPHHSPQYNMLVGQVGIDTGPTQQSSHQKIAKQCTHCHTHQHQPSEPSEDEPVYTGHGFKPLVENCEPCHTPEEAEAFISFRQRTTKAQEAEVKTLLDTWGQTKAPDPLRTTYGVLAWEFNNAGQLSLSDTGASQKGPTSAEQTVVPDEIKQARFYLYMVEHDGSYGVHNAMFTTHLLDEAKKLVQAKLDEQ